MGEYGINPIFQVRICEAQRSKVACNKAKQLESELRQSTTFAYYAV